uniref:NADH-ubiquinone oxidoreductase chain 2 n=1 Tax=Prosopocoilus astacoides TaxID=618406 RepID=A0A7H1DJI1_9SCAR|nr:NADH dehydrogenase subunit 2 [Prosopocoilus astacoides]QNS37123.1 NADH dehydrogenase subunit 2 [Prosopocoilus astacoides]UTM10014.1 NADH dehydrogenase subunit 2 [Prosopocoilus astacoides castaneus]
MWFFNKMLFGSSLALGTVIAISSYSWMGMWMGLEINLLSFVPLISMPKNSYSSESALKYFVAQAAASTILLLALVVLSSKSSFLMSKYDYAMVILNTSLLLKMGAAPLHFWFPEVMEGLSWMNATILLTWQKIAPMVLLIYTNKTLILMFSVVISCMLISGIMGQNHLSLRKIMAYSSINHIGWMIAASLFMEIIWMIYFVIYTIINLNIVIMFKKLNIFYMKQLILSISYEPLLKLFFILNFLSLGGLPPFLGFFPKWLTIQILTENQFSLLAVIMIVATLATLFFYMRVTFSTFVLSSNSLTCLPYHCSNKFFIMTANLVTLASLILSTLVFNIL